VTIESGITTGSARGGARATNAGSGIGFGRAAARTGACAAGSSLRTVASSVRMIDSRDPSVFAFSFIAFSICMYRTTFLSMFTSDSGGSDTRTPHWSTSASFEKT